MIIPSAMPSIRQKTPVPPMIHEAAETLITLPAGPHSPPLMRQASHEVGAS